MVSRGLEVEWEGGGGLRCKSPGVLGAQCSMTAMGKSTDETCGGPHCHNLDKRIHLRSLWRCVSDNCAERYSFQNVFGWRLFCSVRFRLWGSSEQYVVPWRVVDRIMDCHGMKSSVNG